LAGGAGGAEVIERGSVADPDRHIQNHHPIGEAEEEEDHRNEGKDRRRLPREPCPLHPPGAAVKNDRSDSKADLRNKVKDESGQGDIPHGGKGGDEGSVHYLIHRRIEHLAEQAYLVARAGSDPVKDIPERGEEEAGEGRLPLAQEEEGKGSWYQSGASDRDLIGERHLITIIVLITVSYNPLRRFHPARYNAIIACQRGEMG